MSESKDRVELSSLEKIKYLFNNDYINEFGGLDLSLQSLKSGVLDIQTFKDYCVKFAKNKNGYLVLKFSDKYHLPVPLEYKEKIEAMDILVDKINVWVSEFLKDENGKNIDDLAVLVEEANNIINEARKEEKPYR
ncbi:MAG: hypothetical protein A2563_00400 [Candidatus Magasanikbacteria bacterium RIFOXYD1_FULL_40_23]|uniref:Uncharacterized protein n=1 Tax=Candidatus Magasanikbacteria bacterium RIFOXYD1_FULL_40_23 TaxID=1798705 RepID=A0A1F6PAZ4_9BACT|nr:MAG: hypothetical protein A2563_00400 [Candidatus Magasanikbacteria bacterium RIFOXYD1_FULL_40_23]